MIFIYLLVHLSDQYLIQLKLPKCQLCSQHGGRTWSWSSRNLILWGGQRLTAKLQSGTCFSYEDTSKGVRNPLQLAHEVGEDSYPSDSGSWMEVGEGRAFGTSPAGWDFWLGCFLAVCLQMMDFFKSRLPHFSNGEGSASLKDVVRLWWRILGIPEAAWGH